MCRSDLRLELSACGSFFLGGWFLYRYVEGNSGLIHPSNTGGSGVAIFAHASSVQ